MVRATWLIKMTCAYYSAISEAKIKKRQATDPNLGKWDSTVHFTFHHWLYEDLLPACSSRSPASEAWGGPWGGCKALVAHTWIPVHPGPESWFQQQVILLLAPKHVLHLNSFHHRSCRRAGSCHCHLLAGYSGGLLTVSLLFLSLLTL